MHHSPRHRREDNLRTVPFLFVPSSVSVASSPGSESRTEHAARWMYPPRCCATYIRFLPAVDEVFSRHGIAALPFARTHPPGWLDAAPRERGG